LNSAISGFASFLLQRYAISPKLQNIIGGEREIAGVVSERGRFCSRDGEIGGFVSMDGHFCSRDGEIGGFVSMDGHFCS